MERSRKDAEKTSARTDPWSNMRGPNDSKR